MKQDKELFKILLEKFHLNPEECFFIDNNPKNIAIAEEFGIKGYPYQEDKNIEYLYENLRKNGIL